VLNQIRRDSILEPSLSIHFLELMGLNLWRFWGILEESPKSTILEMYTSFLGMTWGF
jgi:hypothetical protein